MMGSSKSTVIISCINVHILFSSNIHIRPYMSCHLVFMKQVQGCYVVNDCMGTEQNRQNTCLDLYTNYIVMQNITIYMWQTL